MFNIQSSFFVIFFEKDDWVKQLFKKGGDFSALRTVFVSAGMLSERQD